MDGQRSFSDEPESRWSRGERAFSERYADSSYGDQSYGEPGYAEGAGYPDPGYPERERFRVPDPRTGDGPRGPRSGEPLPPIPPSGPPGGQHQTGPMGPPPGLQPPMRERPQHTGEIPLSDQRRGQPQPGAVYRSRRPGLAALLIVLTVVFEVAAFRALASSALADTISVPGTVASSLMVIALPMLGLGLYGLASGAAATPGADGRVWFRPPLAYLPIALVLLLGAALAA